MKVRQLSEEEVKHLTDTYAEVVDLMHRSELDPESLLGVPLQSGCVPCYQHRLRQGRPAVGCRGYLPYGTCYASIER